MTEEEAKTKWCPFVRLTADGLGEWHTNRSACLPSDPGDTQAYRCIGSDCMAWRWDEKSLERVDVVMRKSDGYLTDPGRSIAGYCGLAGAPQ